jgi:hypothetical protein
MQVAVFYERRELILGILSAQLQFGLNQPRDTLMQQELL